MHAGLTTRVSEAYKIYTSPLLLSQVGREAVFYLQWYPGWAQHKMGSFGAILTFVVLETDLKWSSLALKSRFFSLACLLSAWIIGMYHYTLPTFASEGGKPSPLPKSNKTSLSIFFFSSWNWQRRSPPVTNNLTDLLVLGLWKTNLGV